MIASVALLAGAANAAAMTWGTGVMYKPDTTTGAFTTTKAKATVTAYYFELDAATYASLYVADDYAATAKKVFDAYASVDGKAITVTGATDSGKTGSTSNYKNFTDSRSFGVGDTAYAAMILTYTDATAGDFYIANLASYKFEADMDGNLKAFGTNQFGDGANAALTGFTAAAVPEPTSGLLLLLGMVGLALKRKRA